MAINLWLLAPTTMSIQNTKLNNDGDEALAAFNLFLLHLCPRTILRLRLCGAFVHSFLLRVYLPVNQTRSPRGDRDGHECEDEYGNGDGAWGMGLGVAMSSGRRTAGAKLLLSLKIY